LVLSRWATLFFTDKINTSEDSFKHWKLAFTLLFSQSHLETEILLFVGFFESLCTQRLNELAVNESHNFFAHVLSGRCRETLSLISPENILMWIVLEAMDQSIYRIHAQSGNNGTYSPQAVQGNCQTKTRSWTESQGSKNVTKLFQTEHDHMPPFPCPAPFLQMRLG